MLTGALVLVAEGLLGAYLAFMVFVVSGWMILEKAFSSLVEGSRWSRYAALAEG